VQRKLPAEHDKNQNYLKPDNNKTNQLGYNLAAKQLSCNSITDHAAIAEGVNICQA
jgi:hypothetical protein